MRIRRATRADGPAFLRLVHELASYEKLAGPTPEAEARLLDDAFGARPRFELTVAEVEGSVVAYAATFETYATFRARSVLYLEDLYVTPAARRHGVARALMAHLARDALARGCVRLAWVVLDWNEPARRFYAALGAAPTEGWVPYAIQDEALERLAGSA